ncbi:unnamed protein product [Nyctereutes procyonoides]|uniref:18 kDa Sin3-associated polypeptide n=1 Tax=Nyctereutes procyonoides TaxID=34880 RepID=A0A811Z5J6_NYCPR|nr:unnamed protein product [Nyctereutes procyonoides]
MSFKTSRVETADKTYSLPAVGGTWRWSRKTCPLLLLRVFTTNNGCHHRMDEFSHGNVPTDYLVKEVYPEARKKGTHFNFAIEIGSTMSGMKGTDDSMTLQSQKFQIGGYLDIAITPPNQAPPPSGCMRPY